ncbi:MAG: hypothetical protein D3911_02355 [Candidatus Electrothrix sp. AW3_4]|nr:hypothetical protein [Candidatus Electrothrix gigas]
MKMRELAKTERDKLLKTGSSGFVLGMGSPAQKGIIQESYNEKFNIFSKALEESINKVKEQNSNQDFSELNLSSLIEDLFMQHHSKCKPSIENINCTYKIVDTLFKHLLVINNLEVKEIQLT